MLKKKIPLGACFYAPIKTPTKGLILKFHNVICGNSPPSFYVSTTPSDRKRAEKYKKLIIFVLLQTKMIVLQNYHRNAKANVHFRTQIQDNNSLLNANLIEQLGVSKKSVALGFGGQITLWIS